MEELFARKQAQTDPESQADMDEIQDFKEKKFGAHIPDYSMLQTNRRLDDDCRITKVIQQINMKA